MCNANNHPPDCDCGFGGDTGSGGGWEPQRRVWVHRDDDFTRPTCCPECGRDVFFVRYNGGAVWFDALGPPWDKHPCFDDSNSGRWIRGALRLTRDEDGTPVKPTVFGIVVEMLLEQRPASDRVVVRCSDGPVVELSMLCPEFVVGEVVIVRRAGGMTTILPIYDRDT